jgi:hypothetical protein
MVSLWSSSNESAVRLTIMRSIKPLLTTMLSTLLLTMTVATPLLADTAQMTSGDKQVALVELFTSEGCSSCPPAEAWMNRFVNDEMLWKRVIPMAFHVDYWDYIGWKDSFAQSRFSERQYRYQKEGGIRTVYTPGVLLNGKEWRGWHRQIAKTSNEPIGALSLKISTQGVSAQFKPLIKPTGDLQLHVAVLAFGINTEVAAGENSGRQLSHEFVVVGLNDAVSSNLNWQMALPEVRAVGAKRHALVAWVSERGKQRPLQAVGDWIAGSLIKIDG